MPIDYDKHHKAENDIEQKNKNIGNSSDLDNNKQPVQTTSHPDPKYTYALKSQFFVPHPVAKSNEGGGRKVERSTKYTFDILYV